MSDLLNRSPYALVCDLKPGGGEIGRLYGVEVWEQNGEPYVHPTDAGDETE